jgi:uncharacterized membrane protein YfcA
LPLANLLSILAFTVPCGLVGGRLGSLPAGRMPERTLVRSLAWAFVAIAALTAFEAFA